jgi:hypothetical protein
MSATTQNDIDDLIDYALMPNAQNQVIWQPFTDSPQALAYASLAQIIGFGGAAGGGKTDLLLGKAFTQKKRARIFRRNYTDLSDLIDRGDAILNGLARYVRGDKRRWDLPDGRVVRLAAVEYAKDLSSFQGRAADMLGFDEATQFPEKFIRYLMGWLRTDDPTVSPQVVMTFNPPMSAEQEWVIPFFKPWLDPTHPNPARDGELRWFITVHDQDLEVDDNQPVTIDGETYIPQSRTFFRALVEDNPVYMATGYRDQLNSLPEPLRSQLLKGDFSIRPNDDRYQVIPTVWVLEANKRWELGQRPDLLPKAVGVDVARGGSDETVIAVLRENWFDLVNAPGTETTTGDSVADLIETIYEADTPVIVDVTGVGASAYDSAIKRFGDVRAFVASGRAGGRDQTGRYGFLNARSEAWWKLREALNPESGQDIALPPDPKLRADLTAPRYSVQNGKYRIESKDEIFKRLKRSTDRGDAVTMAWWCVTQSSSALRDIDWWE